MSTEEQRALQERVLIYPPTRRDGEVTCQLLARARVGCHVCTSLRSLAADVDAGVGAVMLTDSALGDPDMALLHASLGRQPGGPTRRCCCWRKDATCRRPRRMHWRG
jgi:hypothetical protein